MITLLEIKNEHRMAVKCSECGRIEYFYTSMQSPFNCPSCYKTFPNIMPLAEGPFFRMAYYQNGSVTRNA